jgi:hypothetical protein
MARFGRGIVEQLTNPAFGRGMFDLGQKIGGMPAQAREEKKKKLEKAALIDVENQLRQIVAVSSEAARAGNVDLISNQISSINEQLKTEDNDAKRQRLTDTYKVLTQNLSTARANEEKTGAVRRQLEVDNVGRGGRLSYEDGNLVGVIAARNEVRKRLLTEQNGQVQSQLLSTLKTLNDQIEGIDAKKSERNISDLMKAELLYEQLEGKGQTRTENESKVMGAVKQRIDQLREDPDTVRAVKDQRSKQRLAEITQDNQIQSGLETQGIAILSSLNPESKEYKQKAQDLRNNNLGAVVRKVEKANAEAEKARIELEIAESGKGRLSDSQNKLAIKMGVPIQEGFDTQTNILNRSMYVAALKKRSDQRSTLALRDMQPLDEPGARATVQNILYDLKEQGDLSFAKDFLMTDLEDELRGMSSEDQEYLINSVVNETPEEAEQIVLKFVQRKFPKSFEATQTEKTAEAEYEQSLRDAMAATFEKYPELDSNDPVDQAKVMEAANKQLRQAMGVPTASEIFFGQTQRYDQGRGER